MTHDAVVIGAGHNGLVAANVLADEGWSVLVCEADDEAGGAVRSSGADRARFRPRPVQRLFSARRRLAGVPIARDRASVPHGPLVLAHPALDGSCAVLSREEPWPELARMCTGSSPGCAARNDDAVPASAGRAAGTARAAARSDRRGATAAPGFDAVAWGHVVQDGVQAGSPRCSHRLYQAVAVGEETPPACRADSSAKTKSPRQVPGFLHAAQGTQRVKLNAAQRLLPSRGFTCSWRQPPAQLLSVFQT